MPCMGVGLKSAAAAVTGSASVGLMQPYCLRLFCKLKTVPRLCHLCSLFCSVMSAYQQQASMASQWRDQVLEGGGGERGGGEKEAAPSPDRLWKETSRQLCPLKVDLTQLHLSIIEVSLDAQGFPVLACCPVKLRLDSGLQVFEGPLHGSLVQELARHAQVYIAPLQHTCIHRICIMMHVAAVLVCLCYCYVRC